MLATSTHDTKRSEDVRARLALLSEIPGRWADAVARWFARNQRHRAARRRPIRNARVPALPDARRRLAARAPTARPRIVREGGARGQGAHLLARARRAPTRPRCARFVDGALADRGFVAASSRRFAAAAGRAGRVNSLAQLAAQARPPGRARPLPGHRALGPVSLVDPDNRRPVDFAAAPRAARRPCARRPASTCSRAPTRACRSCGVVQRALARAPPPPGALRRRAAATSRCSARGLAGASTSSPSPATRPSSAPCRGSACGSSGWADTARRAARRPTLARRAHRRALRGRGRRRSRGCSRASRSRCCPARRTNHDPLRRLGARGRARRARHPRRPLPDAARRRRLVAPRATRTTGDRLRVRRSTAATPLPDPRSPLAAGRRRTATRGRVDHAAFRVAGRRLRRAQPLARAVLYELHVGTFTPAGHLRTPRSSASTTWSSSASTHVELMPVAEFPGEHGWGYDGVALFAPHHAYGGPDGLKRFVDACHARGLAVILDVVYNHLGPDGNYLAALRPVLHRASYGTPWGARRQPRRPRQRRGAPLLRRQRARCGCATTTSTACASTPCTRIVDRSPLHFLEELRARGRRAGAAARPAAVPDRRERRSTIRAWCGRARSRRLRPRRAVERRLPPRAPRRRSPASATATTPTSAAARTWPRRSRAAFVYDGRYSPHRRRRHGRADPRPRRAPASSASRRTTIRSATGRAASDSRHCSPPSASKSWRRSCCAAP